MGWKRNADDDDNTLAKPGEGPTARMKLMASCSVPGLTSFLAVSSFSPLS